MKIYTKTKANTISAQTVLPPTKISDFGDFGHVLLYYNRLQSMVGVVSRRE